MTPAPGAAVVVLGDVMTDVIARYAGRLAVGSDTAATVVLRPGGAAANTAAWLGHLGARCVFCGCVGDDALGRDAAAALHAVGVETRLEVAAGAVTGTCVVLVDGTGERTMLPDAGANALLGRPDVVVPGGHLHASGYTLLSPGSRAAGAAALAAAREAGMTTSVDPASAAPLAAMGADAFRALIAGVDLVFVTLDEAEVLCGTRDPDRVAGDLRAAHPEVVLKLGAAGARWHGPGGTVAAVPAAIPPGPVVDTPGAGDAFAAAFLAARADGEDPESALRAACALAAAVCAQPGARPGRAGSHESRR
ncbi:MAG: carbohydrate kinase family protein [Thermoleophilia bacterium]|nr:carbohydrate kinase family protein [Thermoleophilia bacterium]